jgi:hypothetical protein
MPRLLRVPLLAICLLGAPVAANAAQVDITYEVTGGQCCLDLDDGYKPVIGGTATIRWSLSSLNGGFLNAQPATVLNFTLVTSGAASVTHYFLFSGAPQFVGSQSIAISAGTLPTTFENRIRHVFGTPPALQATASALCPALFCGTTITIPAAQVSGEEVSRTLVGGPPAVPLSGALGLPALAMLLALAGWRRISRAVGSRSTSG